MECKLFQALNVCLNQVCIVTVCVDLSQVEKCKEFHQISRNNKSMVCVVWCSGLGGNSP